MNGFAGTGTLVRLGLRRDRLLIPLSALALVGVVAGSARATFELYPDVSAAMPAMRSLLENPALVAMYGPLSDPTSLDAFATFKVVLLGAVFLGILAYAVVRRHTRAEEETGRLELLSSGVVDRRAPLAAAVLIASGAVLLTAVLTAVASIQVGLDRAGSIALGGAWLTIGLAMVAVTAVAAQLTESAKGCAQLALGALGIFYLLRLVGDTASDGSPLRFLTWLSPLGWGEKVAPFGANRLWVVGLGIAFYVVVTAAAFVLLSRRDVGGSIFPPRSGPARGALSTNAGLVARLARGTVLIWAVAFAALGLLLGSVAGSVESFVDSPEMEDLLRKLGGDASSITDTFFATEFAFMGIAAAALGLAIVLRLRSEETAGRAETLLATPLSRVRWAGDQVVAAALATTAGMAVLGLSVGVVNGIRINDVRGSVLQMLGAALSTLPAVWVCVGVAMVLIGAVPRFATFAWGFLVIFLVLGELGDVLNLPGWLTNLSPFAHLPNLPGGAVEWMPLALLTLIAAALIGAGIAALRRRDIPA